MAALEVYNLDKSVAMLDRKREYRISWFTYTLDKKPSMTYLELLTHAQMYSHVEKADHT